MVCISGVRTPSASHDVRDAPSGMGDSRQYPAVWWRALYVPGWLSSDMWESHAHDALFQVIMPSTGWLPSQPAIPPVFSPPLCNPVRWVILSTAATGKCHAITPDSHVILSAVSQGNCQVNATRLGVILSPQAKNLVVRSSCDTGQPPQDVLLSPQAKNRVPYSWTLTIQMSAAAVLSLPKELAPHLRSLTSVHLHLSS
jgi:hypothetical protein